MQNIRTLIKPFHDRRTNIVIIGSKESFMQKIKVLTQEMRKLYAFWANFEKDRQDIVLGKQTGQLKAFREVTLPKKRHHKEMN